MTGSSDLIEKVARAIQDDISIEPESWFETARFDDAAIAAIAVVLNEVLLRVPGDRLGVLHGGIKKLARENGVSLDG